MNKNLEESMNARLLQRMMVTVLFFTLSLLPCAAVFANPESLSLSFISQITNIIFWGLMLFIIRENNNDREYYDWG